MLMGSFSSFGVAFWTKLRSDEIVELARRVDSEQRFDSFWIAEIPHFRSAIPIATACANVTRRLKLGLGVLGSHTRHPAVIAMEARTLHEVSSGRIILGLGAARTAATRHNWTCSHLATMKDALMITRDMLHGKKLDYVGKAFEVHSTELDGAFDVPIYVGTYPFSEKMLQLAATLADGVILVWTTPELVKKAVRTIRTQAERIGRDMSSFDIAAYLIVSVDDDENKARAACEPLLQFYSSRIVDLWTKNSLISETSNDRNGVDLKGLVDTLAIAGKPSYCVERLEELAEAGLRTPIFYQVIGPDRLHSMQLIANEIIPSLSHD